MFLLLVIFAVLSHALMKTDPLTVEVIFTHKHAAPAVLTAETTFQAAHRAIARTLRLIIFFYFIVLGVYTIAIIRGVRRHTKFLILLSVVYS